MSKTFTPTHCPETGRKFTKAERKAANKAKYAALRAEQAALPKPTQEAKPRKAQAKAVTAPSPKEVTLQSLMRHTKAELCQMIQGYQAASLVTPVTPAAPAAPAAPAKAVRSRKPNANERLEARMQRESTRKREALLAKADERSRKVVDAATGKQAEAFAERKEVYVAPTEHKAKRDKAQLTGLQGLSPEDAARRDALLREREALEQALLGEFEAFEDSPF